MFALRTRAAGARRWARPAAVAGAVAALVLLGGLPAAAQGLRLAGLAGDELRESDLARGSTVLVVFTTWSPHCRDIGSRVNALDDGWGRRARVVAVSLQEDRETVRSFVSGQSLRAPVYLDADGAFSKKHGVTKLPGLIIFRDGEVAFEGQLPQDPDPTVRDALGG